ncbi:MAG TPA: BTAD domain-containing putative transcriptional regulator [Pilimelia sp.]|nr:BTAD domain-containing putative transcriptional regulator [Pilimelia sp.]
MVDETRGGGDRPDTVEFRILGPIQVWAGGRARPAGEPRQRAVLAALLINVGRVVSVETLVDRVWGDAPPMRARRSLQAHIARVRRILDDVAGSSWTRPRVVREPGGYVVAATEDQVDALRFRRLVAQARRPDVPESTRAWRLREALDLWRGEPLAGIPGAWATRIRCALRQDHIDATVAWARAEIRLGNADAMVWPLTDLADEFPAQEVLAATLMTALYAVGRTTDALGRYEQTRALLREEFGADPGPELRAVHRGVLRHALAGIGRQPDQGRAPR